MVYFEGDRDRKGGGLRSLNQECCCSSTLGSESSLRNRGFAWAGRSNAATKAFHWSASNEKRRWSASVCSASAQALRTMKSVKLSPRSCAPRRISFSCCAEVLRFRRRDRGAFKVEGITSSSVRTLYSVADNFGSPGRIRSDLILHPSMIYFVVLFGPAPPTLRVYSSAMGLPRRLYKGARLHGSQGRGAQGPTQSEAGLLRWTRGPAVCLTRLMLPFPSGRSRRSSS